MFIVNKNFIIEKSNVAAFNSFVGKDSNNIHLSLAMRSNELNEGLNKAFEKNLKLDVNLLFMIKFIDMYKHNYFLSKSKKKNSCSL